ncbi:MAG: hypothetical protein WCL34_04350 [Methylococcaceae bacterium]|jgi:hypothetical protein
MIAFRQIYDDAPAFVQVSIPKELQHQSVEIILLPLNDSRELPIKRRKPPAQFAGRVKELGDVMNSLTAEDWGVSE